jgi:aminoglycoside phosphotransferase family enzyme
MAVVIDERRVLRKSLFDRRRTFNQNRTDRSGHGDATLTHILIKVREIRKLDAIKLKEFQKPTIFFNCNFIEKG